MKSNVPPKINYTMLKGAELLLISEVLPSFFFAFIFFFQTAYLA